MNTIYQSSRVLKIGKGQHFFLTGHLVIFKIGKGQHFFLTGHLVIFKIGQGQHFFFTGHLVIFKIAQGQHFFLTGHLVIFKIDKKWLILSQAPDIMLHFVNYPLLSLPFFPLFLLPLESISGTTFDMTAVDDKCPECGAFKSTLTRDLRQQKLIFALTTALQNS